MNFIWHLNEGKLQGAKLEKQQKEKQQKEKQQKEKQQKENQQKNVLAERENARTHSLFLKLTEPKNCGI